MKQLKDIMSHDVEVVRPDADLREIAHLMKEHNVGVLPVCDGQKIQGIVTDRDVVVRALAEQRDPAFTRARDIMSKEVYWCYEDDSIQDAARIMQDQQVRRLIVVDHDKNLCGILSTKDLVLKGAKEGLLGETFGEVSRPTGWARARGMVRRPFGSVLLGAAALGVGFWLYSRREAEMSEEKAYGRGKAA